jgi:S1-C subfamily serine protease
MKKDLEKQSNNQETTSNTDVEIKNNEKELEKLKIEEVDSVHSDSHLDLEISKIKEDATPSNTEEQYDTERVLELLKKISEEVEESENKSTEEKGENLDTVNEELTSETKTKNKKNNDNVFIKSVATSTIISLAIAGGALYMVKENYVTPATKITIADYETDNVYKAVAAKASPSVVGITTTTESVMFPWYGTVESEGIGTGVIVSEDGYILTNSHVVNDGDVKKVTALFNDSTVVEGEVIWNDTTLDLALVKVDKKGLTAADLGNSDELEVGDLAIAIGNPLDLKYNTTVTQGIISGLNRAITLETGEMTDLIQTDASINPGNSGGPLLNVKGEVIGINTAKASDAEGVGFSIPINIAKSIIAEVIETGNFERVVLGIRGYDVAQLATQVEITREDGVFIFEVEDDSPAKKAGIVSGDTIIAIGDKTVTSMSDLTKALYSYSKGDKTTVTIYKDGAEKQLDVQF